MESLLDRLCQSQHFGGKGWLYITYSFGLTEPSVIDLLAIRWITKERFKIISHNIYIRVVVCMCIKKKSEIDIQYDPIYESNLTKKHTKMI